LPPRFKRKHVGEALPYPLVDISLFTHLREETV
jgi:hypothetical protein